MAVGISVRGSLRFTMFLQKLAAIFSVPRVYHTSCSGHALVSVGHALHVSHIGRERPAMDHVKMYGSMPMVVSPEGP